MTGSNVQILCEINDTKRVLRLLCKNADPSTCLGTCIKPILWAAYHSNIILIAALNIFGGCNTAYLYNLYPGLYELVSPKVLLQYPELLNFHAVCPIKFLAKVSPALCSQLVSRSIYLKRLQLKEKATSDVKLLFYYSRKQHHIICKHGKDALLCLLFYLKKNALPDDIFHLIIKFIHAYSW